MDGHADAMVRHSVLWEVVGPDLFAAITGSDLKSTGVTKFVGATPFLKRKQASAQDGHCACLVLELRTLILAGYDETGRLVGYPDGGVGRVDALAPMPAGAIHIDFEIVWIDADIDFLGFGKYGDGGSRGVDATRCLSGGDTLHAVDAALELQAAVRTLATNLKDDLLVASDPGAIGREHLGAPTLAFGVARVHAGEV